VRFEIASLKTLPSNKTLWEKTTLVEGEKEHNAR